MTGTASIRANSETKAKYGTVRRGTGMERKNSFFSTPETVEADIREAEEARKKGYRGHTLEEVLREMDRIIEEVGVEGT